MSINRLDAWLRVVSMALCATFAAEAGLSGAPGGHDRRARVPFQLDVGGRVLVPAVVGGLSSQPCVVDTGASRTLISDRLKTRLALAAVARAPVVSSAGQAVHDVVKLPSVTIGDVTHAGLFATVLPAERMRRIADDVACIIGHDFLAAQDFTIDYEKKTLSWHGEPASPDRRSTHIPLLATEDQYVVELRQSAGSRETVRLVPDSGASAIVLFRQPQPPPLTLFPLTVPVVAELSAATGDSEVSAVRVMRLDIGNIALKDREAYLVDRAMDERTGAQGLLPLHFFARVSFNVSDGTVVVTPR